MVRSCPALLYLTGSQHLCPPGLPVSKPPASASSPHPQHLRLMAIPKQPCTLHTCKFKRPISTCPCPCPFLPPCCRHMAQDFEALTPNLLARTIETVEGGGLVVLLLSNLSSLTQLYTLTMDVHARLRTDAHQTVTGGRLWIGVVWGEGGALVITLRQGWWFCVLVAGAEMAKCSLTPR